jgi:hypothetical protein
MSNSKKFLQEKAVSGGHQAKKKKGRKEEKT